MASNQDPQPANAAEALERLGRLALRELSMDSLLQAVADLAKTVMPGNPETSVLLLVKDKPTTVAHTGQLAVDLDETQYERGHGPCLHAARTGELTEIADTRTETRWQDYTQRAAERGNLSSLSIPLVIDEDEQVTGALNVYARQPDAFERTADRSPPGSGRTPQSRPATCTPTRAPATWPTTSRPRSSPGRSSTRPRACSSSATS